MLNKKIIAMCVMAMSFSLTAHAKALICPFTDNFTLRVPEGNKIINYRVEGNLTYTQTSDVEFKLQCGDGGNFQDGTLFVDVGNNDVQCNLKIKDGPMYTNPEIDVLDCTDPTKLRYVNTEHTFGTYQYTLVFKGVG